jgi:hypothetical protein
MAQRTLDASFWDDEDVARLGFGERLLLACMITDVSLSDDYGNLPAGVKVLKKHAFGYDDDVTVEQVRQWRDGILSKCRNVRLYVVDNQEYITLVKFQQWQDLRYQRKSQIPPPPVSITGESAGAADKLAEMQQVDEQPETVADDCGNISENFGNVPEHSENFPLSRVGLSRVEKSRVEEEAGAGAPGAAPAPDPVSLVFQRWMDINPRRQITPIDVDTLNDMIADYGAPEVAEAIVKANAQGKPVLAYVEGILKRIRDGTHRPVPRAVQKQAVVIPERWA